MADSADLSKLWEGWAPPEGLNRSWPRPVSLTASGILLFVMSALLAMGGVVGGALLARQGRRQEAEARRMLAEGQVAEGVVTRLWRTGGKSDEHRVAYRFTVEGREHNGRATIRSGYWKSLRVGSPIPVRYLPSSPGRNYPSANPPRPVPLWLPMLLGTIGVGMGGLLPLTVRRQRHLLADGRPAPAVVTRYSRLQTEHGAQNIVYYEFALLGGGTCKGRASTNRRLPVGSAICVLYDPDNPRRSAPYPMCLVKLAAL